MANAHPLTERAQPIQLDVLSWHAAEPGSILMISVRKSPGAEKAPRPSTEPVWDRVPRTRLNGPVGLIQFMVTAEKPKNNKRGRKHI